MTRINVVPPRELTDKHLVAEYRELPRVFGLSSNWLRRGKDTKVPKTYTLGKGHVAFFYDKVRFLEHRYAELVAEMRRRGFKVQYPKPRHVPVSEDVLNHYTPTAKALAINRQRITDRLNGN